MEIDPIAENQTDVAISALMARKDGDVELYHAVAALLAFTKKQGKELMEIRSSLWSPDALDRRIEVKHESECRNCTVRKWVEDYQRQLELEKEKGTNLPKPSLWSFLFSERGLLTIVVIILTLAFVRMSLGHDGYKDVTGSIHRQIPAQTVGK